MMKVQHAALVIACAFVGASAFAQGSKSDPGSLQQRGEQMKPQTNVPAKPEAPSAMKTEAQKAADATKERGEQMRPKPASELKSAAPTGMTEAERKAAMAKERGEQMKPK